MMRNNNTNINQKKFAHTSNFCVQKYCLLFENYILK